SWLNMAEIELRALTGQCLDRRMPDMATLHKETSAWEQRRNARHQGVDWQFTTQNARIKLKRLYPQIHEGQGTSLPGGRGPWSVSAPSLRRRTRDASGVMTLSAKYLPAAEGRECG